MSLDDNGLIHCSLLTDVMMSCVGSFLHLLIYLNTMTALVGCNRTIRVCHGIPKKEESLEKLQHMYHMFRRFPHNKPAVYGDVKYLRKKFDNLKCGTMAVDPLTAIVGGTNAHPKAFPWQALIVSGRSKCGGVLISTSWVLTAAHCFRNVSRVHLGVTNYKSSKANWQSKDVAVYAKHKLYNGHSDSDDIGLMKLASPVKINDYVRPACLPKPGADFETSYPCFISGWGRTSPKAVKGHHVLQFTRVDVLPQNICVYMWKLSAKDVDMRNICTDKTRSSRGACFGDSGGPLTCEMDGRYYAAGVASFIYGHCDARFHPDVYTRVSQYEHWIFTTIHKYGFK